MSMLHTPPADLVAGDPAATLAAWQADDAALRGRQPRFGVARPDEIAGLNGLEMMQALLEGRLPAPMISQTLDFMLVDATLGRAVFQGRPGRAHLNPMGTVHGGWYATLLDSAVGCAVHTLLEPGKAYTTAELKVNIVRPLGERVPLVRAEGRVIHPGNRVATAEGRLYGPDGKLYAHASTTCFVFDAA